MNETHDPGLHRLVLNSIEQAVFSVDEEQRITSFNAAAEDLVGIAEHQALGRRCYEVFRTDACQRGCALRRTLGTGESFREGRVWLVDGPQRRTPVGVQTAPLRDGNGRMMGAVELLWKLPESEICSQQASVRRPSVRAIMEAEIDPGAGQLQSPEAQRLARLLQAHSWNRAETAAALGISRSTLWRRMKEFGLID